MEYLELLYTPEEAELVCHLNPPISLSPKYFLTAAQVAEAAGRDEEEVRRILDGAAARGGIVGIGGAYAMPTVPLLVNAHQFSEEVGPDDLEASRLYQQYFIKGGFYKYYESSEAGTPLMRVIPVMRAIEFEQKVLDSEEAHRIIDACENISLVPCPCRTRTEKMDIRECKDKYPVGACIMTELSALYFQTRGSGAQGHQPAGQAVPGRDAGPGPGGHDRQLLRPPPLGNLPLLRLLLLADTGPDALGQPRRGGPFQLHPGSERGLRDLRHLR